MKKDGTITARQVTTIWDTGAYADAGPRVTRNSGHTSAGPYRLPHVKIDGYTVYTNKNVAVPFRGYGVQEVCWAYETHTDELAAELHIDPVEFRLKNGLRPGDLTATGEEVTSTSLISCLEKAKVRRMGASLQCRASAPAEAKGSRQRNRHDSQGHGAPSTSSAIVKFNEDGTVTLLMGTVDQGTGSDTILCQIVAEELGMRMEDISISPRYRLYALRFFQHLEPFDVSHGQCDPPGLRRCQTAGHRGRRQAAEGTARRGRAGRWDCSPVKDDPGKRIALKDVVLSYFGYRGGTLIGRGVYKPSAISPDKETGLTPKMTPFWMYGVQGAEVEVDLETGKVEVVKMAACHDVGARHQSR